MARVNQIIPFSCIDGPGNRMAIFFQGCNLKCTYCHNPETINHCKHCGRCVSQCPTQALALESQQVVWNKEKCVGCDGCTKICGQLASPKTTDYTVDSLFEEIKRVSPFIQGITVSGGECTLQAAFLVQLFRRVKEELQLTCFVDTNGMIDLGEQVELVQLTDQFMLDIKATDEEEHIRVTGLSNQVVLKNLHYLLSIDKLYEVRTVVAQGLNNEKTIRDVIQIIGSKCKYRLNAYRKHGVRQEGIAIHGEVGPSEEEMAYYQGFINQK
ncbi:MAG: YjjW family glycine radical enzyme activase [Cellulosilyticaceae bacterium]